jgi:hypothetical protein
VVKCERRRLSSGERLVAVAAVASGEHAAGS